ncbi:hypothetical protein Q7P37_009198 [Cladosporium fusiforme]
MSKIVLIIGGTGGLGRATAELLAQKEENSTIIVAGRNASKGAEVVSSITSAGGKASFLPVDLSNRQSIRDLHANIASEHGRLDIAVNAAGVLGPIARLHETSESDLDDIIAVNITGFYLSMQEQIKLMLASPQQNESESESEGERKPVPKRHIVNLASIYGQSGCPYGSAYSTTKHAVIGMTRSAALETAKKGIYINALAPGIIPTNIVEDLGAKLAALPDSEEHAAFKKMDFMALYPAGRFGTPEDVARAVAFVVQNDWMVGSVVTVDGGYGVF